VEGERRKGEEGKEGEEGKKGEGKNV